MLSHIELLHWHLIQYYIIIVIFTFIMNSIVFGRDCSLDTIFHKLLQAPDINFYKTLYTNLAVSLNTPMEQLQFLRNMLCHGKLNYQQVIFELIQEWTRRLEHEATVDAFLAALWSIEWNQIASFLSTELEKEVNQLNSSLNATNKAEWESCGSIQFNKSQILGTGSFGTVVYKGFWNNRNVAVKRLIFETTNEEKLTCETNALLDYDCHENVVKYFCVERVTGEQLPVVLIALELCDITLKNWVENKACIFTNIDPINILRQSTTGLEFLHNNGIVHRDIKPENILLKKLPGNGMRVKICDFGICRRMPLDRTGVTLRTSSGTLGWMAPEILKLYAKPLGSIKSKMSRATDIFSLGCVFYYVIFNGAHPFGDDQISILANVRNCKPQINLQNRSAGQAEIVKLVLNMISERPRSRPPASAILRHHIFWEKKTTLKFLIDVSDVADQPAQGSVIAQCCDMVQYNTLLALYRAPENLGWKQFVCPIVRVYANGNECRRKGYDGDSIMDLLRIIRNMKAHYGNLSADLKKAVGPPPDNFLDYWTVRFPFLVDMVWLEFEKLKGDAGAGLEQYYCQFYDFNCSADKTNMLNAFVERFCKERLKN